MRQISIAARCNLYRVIGDKTYGVPDTDTCSREERIEWLLAKLILKNYYKRTAHPTISISERIKGVIASTRRE